MELVLPVYVLHEDPGAREKIIGTVWIPLRPEPPTSREPLGFSYDMSLTRDKVPLVLCENP